MTPIQEFKERIESLDCNNVNCSDCPLGNFDKEKNNCELTKFKTICEERFETKICEKCGRPL
jgi:hypothetical protein